MPDSKLLSDLKNISRRWNVSPESALLMLDECLELHHLMITPFYGPPATYIEEQRLSGNEFEGLPDWVLELIPADARLDRYCFEDGREIAKLRTARGEVLLAVELKQGSKTSANNGVEPIR